MVLDQYLGQQVQLLLAQLHAAPSHDVTDRVPIKVAVSLLVCIHQLYAEVVHQPSLAHVAAHLRVKLLAFRWAHILEPLDALSLRRAAILELPPSLEGVQTQLVEPTATYASQTHEG